MKKTIQPRTTILIVAALITVVAAMLLYPRYLESRVAAGAEQGIKNAFGAPQTLEEEIESEKLALEMQIETAEQYNTLIDLTDDPDERQKHIAAQSEIYEHIEKIKKSIATKEAKLKD